MTHATIPPFHLFTGRAGEAIELSTWLDDRFGVSCQPSGDPS